MNPRTRLELLPGAAGDIEVAIDEPEGAPRALAVVAHPHPLFGGTLDNKVTQTIARTLVSLGCVAVRPNFRGVGRSGGTHDDGKGETEDLLQVVQTFRQRTAAKYLVLAGISFGSIVQSRVAQRLQEAGEPAQQLVFVGTATSRWQVLPVPENTVVIHGEYDETIPLASVFDWARPQNLPVIVIPGADHFFHGRLLLIKRLLTQQLVIPDA